ncbi:hypothetical protein D3C72_2047020 [compost metagenome]
MIDGIGSEVDQRRGEHTGRAGTIQYTNADIPTLSLTGNHAGAVKTDKTAVKSLLCLAAQAFQRARQ